MNPKYTNFFKPILLTNNSSVVVVPKRITKQPEKDEYTTIKVPNDLILIADRLIGTRGYKSRGEIVKDALRDFLDKYDESAHLEMLNHSASGVKVRDRKLCRVADIQITPQGIHCPVCDASYCEHVRFALMQPDIIDIIKKKTKEGWKLPDV
jgi:Arc/MetJ-type ribon-helix-helix transcriptional regulator